MEDIDPEGASRYAVPRLRRLVQERAFTPRKSGCGVGCAGTWAMQPAVESRRMAPRGCQAMRWPHPAGPDLARTQPPDRA